MTKIGRIAVVIDTTPNMHEAAYAKPSCLGHECWPTACEQLAYGDRNVGSEYADGSEDKERIEFPHES